MAMRDYAPFPGGGPGVPYRPPGPHRLRIGDAERDAATADLGEHYAAGRLNLDELHERVDAVLTAKTFGQLATIMADLPGPGRLPWHAGPNGYWSSMHPGQYPTGGRTFRGLTPIEPEPAEHGARFAALALLLLAMLIWLFTALLFIRHGFYHAGPTGPVIPHGPLPRPGG